MALTLELLKKKRIGFYNAWKACWCCSARIRMEAYRQLERIDQLINIMEET